MTVKILLSTSSFIILLFFFLMKLCPAAMWFNSFYGASKTLLMWPCHVTVFYEYSRWCLASSLCSFFNLWTVLTWEACNIGGRWVFFFGNTIIDFCVVMDPVPWSIMVHIMSRAGLWCELAASVFRRLTAVRLSLEPVLVFSRILKPLHVSPLQCSPPHCDSIIVVYAWIFKAARIWKLYLSRDC